MKLTSVSSTKRTPNAVMVNAYLRIKFVNALLLHVPKASAALTESVSLWKKNAHVTLLIQPSLVLLTLMAPSSTAAQKVSSV